MRSTGFEPMTPAWKAGMLTTTLTSQLLYFILEENFYSPNLTSRENNKCKYRENNNRS